MHKANFEFMNYYPYEFVVKRVMTLKVYVLRSWDIGSCCDLTNTCRFTLAAIKCTQRRRTSLEHKTVTRPGRTVKVGTPYNIN